ncbi:hypothetical protein [Amycolatopsis sp. H20-H5]|uniref:hypothetical protein n=1 Tax=Amycolatopsis sp. H20-H5 TaxID=3046309 RepID=UPI002DB9F5DC|nr:hypothetical protein [Amycolatopsis sp. H20-H5]MEC3975206.1 hypothetical protein [Amycolatopsis sp. H20-H5]
MTITSRAFASLIGPAAIAAGLVMASGATAPASAGVSEHCATIVSKELDKAGHSTVIGQTACSTTSAADALAKSGDTVAGTTSTAAVKSSTLLLNKYKDANYGGGVIYSFYGNAGDCDNAGYHLVNYVSVEINVSSMTGCNGCNAVLVNNEYSNYQTFGLPVVYLGDHYNDNVVALKAYRA